MVPLEGFEPPALALRKPCSTAELQRRLGSSQRRWPVALNGFAAQRQLGPEFRLKSPFPKFILLDRVKPIYSDSCATFGQLRIYSQLHTKKDRINHNECLTRAYYLGTPHMTETQCFAACLGLSSARKRPSQKSHWPVVKVTCIGVI